jgi:hypothetical protein
MGFAYSLSCRRACPRRTNTSVSCSFRPGDRAGRHSTANLGVETIQNSIAEGSSQLSSNAYRAVRAAAAPRDEPIPIYNTVVLIWIAFGGTMKISWARPRPCGLYIERSQSAARRIRALRLGISFIPQVVNFAQAALSRCSMLGIDQNAQGYLAVSVDAYLPYRCSLDRLRSAPAERRVGCW